MCIWDMLIALAALSFEVTLTWPPEISTSLPAAASTSTPPLVAVNVIAASEVPFELVTTIVSVEPMLVVKLIALSY